MVKLSLDIRVIEQIMDSSIMHSTHVIQLYHLDKPYYLIKWKDLSHEHDTWEPIEKLANAVDLLKSWILANKEQKPSRVKHNAQIARICDNVYDTSRQRRKIIRKPKRKKELSKGINKVQQIYCIIDEEEKKQEEQKKNQIFQQAKSSSPTACSQHIEEETKAIKNIQQFNKMEQEEGVKQQYNDQDLQRSISNLDKHKTCKSPIYASSVGEDSIQQKTAGQPLKSKMKVVGRVTAEQIYKILQHFTWKDVRCLKIQLKEGNQTNMRESDLRTICPQMLVEYYEDNGISF